MKPFNSLGEFRPALNADGVAARAVRGAGVTLFSGGVGLALQIIATIVLARIILPAEFGVVTMVTTFSLLLVNFGLNGFTEAVIQHEEVNDVLVSNLFWINLGGGLLLTLAFAACGPVLAAFYKDARVATVTVGISTTIAITSMSVIHLALLKRAMYFSRLSALDVLSRAASMIISITLGVAGWGHWALVAGAIASPATTSVGAWILCRWIPRLPKRAPGTAEMVKFALNTYGRFGVNFATRNLDNVLVGWRLGAHSLGLYKKAYDLFALSAGALISPLTVVAVAALSRLNHDRAEFKRSFVDTLKVIAFVGMGVGAALTLTGRDIIYVLLGHGWEESGRIFAFFGPGIGVMMLYYTHGWIHLSIGTPDRWLRWAVIELAVTVSLFCLGLWWGVAGVAVAWTVSYWVLIVPGLWYAGKPLELGIRPIFLATGGYLVASFCAGWATVGIVRVIPGLANAGGWIGATGRMGANYVLFGTMYVGAVILFQRSLAPVLELMRIIRIMAPASTAQHRPAKESEKVESPVADFVGASAHCGVAKAVDGAQPMVSILIPAYNSEVWIAETIRSALAQTWPRKEIIVVDDGSTDGTLAVARRFESETVKVVAQPNQGAAAARNKAFSLCRGEYIQWLDADDLLAPDKIARQVAAIGRDPRILLSSGFGRFMYRSRRAKFVPTALWHDLSPVEWLVRKLGLNSFMQTATWLVSRELTEAAGPWDTNLLADDDGEYFARVLLASSGVRFAPEARTYYRTPWYSSLGYVGQSRAKIRAHWRSIQLHIEYLRSLEDTPRSRAACIRYLQTCLIYFYPEYRDIVEEAEQLAVKLGGSLSVPSLSWKYAPIKAVFGWGVAKRLQLILPRVRWTAAKQWDRAMLHLENRQTDKPIQTPAPTGHGRSTPQLGLRESPETISHHQRPATK